MIKDAWKFSKECDSCQGIGQPLPPNRMSSNHVLPLEPFQKWVLDFVGPFYPTSLIGNKYIIGIIDYCTKWVEAKALKDNKASLVAKFLY